MTIYHPSLVAGRWQSFTFLEQMANVGSEVERALDWQAKGSTEQLQRAFERALELMYLTIDDPKNKSRLRELTRVYELLVDYFQYANEYGSSDANWRGYFRPFLYAARRGR